MKQEILLLHMTTLAGDSCTMCKTQRRITTKRIAKMLSKFRGGKKKTVF